MPRVEDPSELEPQLEALMLRWVPDMDSRWQRASDQDIAALEQIGGGDLPRCYLWMALRLANGWDTIGCGTLDFSVRTIIDGHAASRFPPHEGMICIADDTAADQPQRRYYDLAHPAKDDAPVYAAGPDEDEFEQEFETLREFIASAVFENHRLRQLPSRCRGVLVAEDGSDVRKVLAPLIEELGFSVPVPCGPLCLMYDDGELALSSYRSPRWATLDVLTFNLSGPSRGELRKFLGVVSTSTELAIRSLDWAPVP